jgi:branched-chain amino acid transport system ATP-binding protein
MAAGSLSGGEQQMLAIARGLMARPKVFLLDEPSMGLAPQLVREIFRIVAELRAEGNTILLVEQNARKALTVADYAYVLEGGEIAQAGAAATLRDDPRILEAYLGRRA